MQSRTQRVRLIISTISFFANNFADKIKDGTDELVLGNIAREAECSSQIHQHVHNLMMAPDGAYASLQR